MFDVMGINGQLQFNYTTNSRMGFCSKMSRDKIFDLL